MSHVRVQVLGGFTVASAKGRGIPIAGSCRPVLAYLLTHRHRPVTKVELAETLWADRDGAHARHCLATALWRLRKVASTHAPSLLAPGNSEIVFNRNSRMWIDAIAMERRLSGLVLRKPGTLGDEELARMERGVRLYRGDYLVGMDAEWACLERQRLRDLYCDALYQLVVAHAERSTWDGVLLWGRRLCREEPLREDVHRWLMLANLHTGNRAWAIAQYRQCQQVLAAELGVAPMAETQALHRELLAGAAPSPASAPSRPPPPNLERVRLRVHRARRLLRACQRQLDAAGDAMGDVAADTVR